MPVTYTSTEYKNAPSFEVIKTEHVDAFKGATLKVYTQTDQVMSDVWEDNRYALVWDGKEAKSIYLGEGSSATVDATPEVIEAYRASLYATALHIAKNNAERIAKQPMSGKRIRVTKGRTDKGLEGLVVYSKEMSYGMGYRAAWKPKLCVTRDGEYTVEKTRTGREYRKYVNVAWVWAQNVIVTDWESRMPSEAELAERAKYAADSVVESLSGYWRQPNVHEFV